MKRNILCRRLLCLCIGLLMLLSPMGSLRLSMPAHAAGTDLAYGKTVYVNGQNSQDQDGSKAVDGSDSTKWCYTSDRVNWLIVDLDGQTTFDTWVLKNAVVGGESWAYDTRDILIQISDDMRAWETVSCVFNIVGEESTGIVCGKLDKPVSASYVRLYIPYGCQYFESQVRIYSFELYNGDYTADSWAEEYNGVKNILSLNQSSASVELNSSVALSNYISATTTGEVTWSTMDTDIVKLNPLTGTATGIEVGKAHVTATATQGGSTVNFEVVVTNADIGDDAEDIARGKTAYASGATNESETAEFAVDGDDTTKWCDNTEHTIKWLAVDLGDVMTFDTWVLKNAGYGGEPGAYNPKSVYIQASEDGIAWTGVDCVVGVTGDIIERRLDTPVSAQYVRVYLPSPSQFDHVSRVYGFELYDGNYRCQGGWYDPYSGAVNTLTAKQDRFTFDVNANINLLDCIQTSFEGGVTFCTEQSELLTIDNATGTAIINDRGTAYVTATAADGGHTVNFEIVGDSGKAILQNLAQTIWVAEENGKYLNEIAGYARNFEKNALDVWVQIRSGEDVRVQSLKLAPGRSAVSLFIPDPQNEGTVTLSLYENKNCTGLPINTATIAVKPVKKFNIYVNQNTHMDIGYTSNPEYLIKSQYPSIFNHAMDMIGQSEAAGDDDATAFKYGAEQNFLLYGSLLKYGTVDRYNQIVRNLANGKLFYPVTHSGAYLGAMTPALLARWSYSGNRYLYDMTGVESNRVAVLTDVQGITQGAVDTLVESGAEYFLFRPNNCVTNWSYTYYPRIFYLHGNNTDNKLLTRSSYHYEVDELDLKTQHYQGDVIDNSFVTSLSKKIVEAYGGESYPYDALLVDFGSDNSDFREEVYYNVKALNSRGEQNGINYVYPRIINSNQTDFFEYIEENYKDEIPHYYAGWEEYWTLGIGAFALESGYAKTLNATLTNAEAMATLSASFFGESYPKDTITDYYDQMAVWYEHTYSGQNGDDYSNNIWPWTRSQLYSAGEKANEVLDSSLTTINGQIATECPSIVIHNTLTYERTDLATLSKAELPTYFDIIDSVTKKTLAYQDNGDGTVSFVAPTVPGNGYKVFKIVEREDAPTFTSSVKATANALENDYFKITFAGDGTISSIIDKETGKELVDPQAEYGFNQYVYMTSVHDATDLLSTESVTASSLSSQVGPVYGTMTADGCEGATTGICDLTRGVTLYSDLPRIDIGNTIVKKPAASYATIDEEGFFTFPFEMEDSFVIQHETTSGVINPEKVSSDINADNDLLYGSSLDFFTVNRWIDIGNNSDFGVVMTMSDTSLVQYGERASYQYNKTRDIQSPYVYNWAFNNKWWTNHQKSQESTVSFHYSFYTREGKDYIEGKDDLLGQNTNNPLIASVVTAAQPEGSLSGDSSQFLTVSADNVEIITQKQSEMNGDGLIFGFHETRGVDTTSVKVDLSKYNITGVTETDLVENDRTQSINNVRFENGVLTFNIKGFDFVTVRCKVTDTVGKTGQVTARTDNSGTLVTWDAVEGASYYEVYRSTAAGFEAAAGNWIGSVAGESYFDAQNTDASCSYRIVSVKNGNRGQASDAAASQLDSHDGYRTPEFEGGLRITSAHKKRISLVWSPCESEVDIRYYYILLNGEIYDKVSGELCSYLDWKTNKAGTYIYTVMAEDVNGNYSPVSNAATVVLSGDAEDYSVVTFRYLDYKTGQALTPAASYAVAVGSSLEELANSEAMKPAILGDCCRYAGSVIPKGSVSSGKSMEVVYYYDFQYGDIDGNGKVDSADALKALQHSVQLIELSETQQKAGDVDINGRVDASDALRILQKSVGLISSFAAETAQKK